MIVGCDSKGVEIFSLTVPSSPIELTGSFKDDEFEAKKTVYSDSVNDMADLQIENSEEILWKNLDDHLTE